jgi:hypothetical protein
MKKLLASLLLLSVVVLPTVVRAAALTQAQVDALKAVGISQAVIDALQAAPSAIVPKALTQAQIDALRAAGISDAVIIALNNETTSTTPPASCYNFKVNLSLGSKGADVTALQQFLFSKGYLEFNASGGNFGPVTRNALIAFQKASGIDPLEYGKAWPLTRAALNSCPVTTTTPTTSTPGAVISNNDLTVTLQSTSIETAYNSARPNTPFLRAVHTFKITPKKDINLSPGRPRFVPNVGVAQTAQQISTMAVSGSVSVVDGLSQLQAGQEYSVAVNTQADTNHMFSGTYKSVLYSLSYKLPSDPNATPYIDINQASNSKYVGGETAAYISSIAQSGDTVSIFGKRFNNSVTVKVGDKTFAASAAPCSNNFVGACGVGESAITFSQSAKGITNANQAVVVSDGKGDSNQAYFTFGVNGNTTGIGSLSNVAVSGLTNNTVTQKTNVNVTWATTEKNTIDRVDVQVCVVNQTFAAGNSNDKCFMAYPNLLNNNKADSVFVWNNVPAGSSAYIKVRKTGNDSVSARSAVFGVAAQPTGGATVKVVTPNGGEVYMWGQNLTYRIEVKSSQPSISGEIFLHDRYGASIQSLGGFDKAVDSTTGMAVYQGTVAVSSMKATPGFYKIQAKINSGSQTIYDETDRLFEVKADTASTAKYYLNELTGKQSVYNAGQSIKITGSGFESNGTPASPDKGFNVQAYMTDVNDLSGNVVVNGVSQGDNAVYNSAANTWSINFTAPSDTTRTYKIEFVLYCSNHSASCFQKYGDSYQIVKTFNFTVKSNNQPDATTLTYHDADTNKDSKITIGELTAYFSLPKASLSMLNIASEIWKRGESYSFDALKGFYLDASGKEVLFLMSAKVTGLTNNTWTQGQRKEVYWHQPVGNVDVSVCRSDTNQCFSAFKNINAASVNNLLVGTNVPATSNGVKKYAYIKVQKTDNPQHFVKSDPFEVISVQ